MIADRKKLRKKASRAAGVGAFTVPRLTSRTPRRCVGSIHSKYVVVPSTNLSAARAAHEGIAVTASLERIGSPRSCGINNLPYLRTAGPWARVCRDAVFFRYLSDNRVTPMPPAVANGNQSTLAVRFPPWSFASVAKCAHLSPQRDDPTQTLLP